MVKAADFRWRVLSTQERVQLGGFAERFTALLHSVLALLAVAPRRSVGPDATGVAFPSARTRPKKPKWTRRLLIVDSQAVKNTCNASIETKGFCHYKCTNGREFWDRFSAPKSLIIKRHLAVDTLGLPFFTHCTKENVTDDQGLIELLVDRLDYFRTKPVNIPKITILHRRRLSSRHH